MITVEAVTKRYRPFSEVDGVTIAAEPGRANGFLGPDGAGQSTTLRVSQSGFPRAAAGLPGPGHGAAAQVLGLVPCQIGAIVRIDPLHHSQ